VINNKHEFNLEKTSFKMMKQYKDYKINAIRFNQDFSLFCCCLETGLVLYQVDPLEVMDRCSEAEVGSIKLCEMHYTSNFVALVSGQPKPKHPENVCWLFDCALKEQIYKITISAPIRNVKYIQEKLVIATIADLQLFTFPEVTYITRLDTGNNLPGLVELTRLHHAEKQIIVYPGKRKGFVQITDINGLDESNSTTPLNINAHQNDINCLAVSQDGMKIATASKNGTLIRVFDTSNGKLVVELRRGTDPAIIKCINFSNDSEYLCCSSDKGTVHIFAIRNTNLNKRMSLANLHVLGSYVDSQWALAKFTIPQECPTLCAFGESNSVIAICMDGTHHKYVFNAEGDCKRESYDVYMDVYDEEEFMRNSMNT